MQSKRTTDIHFLKLYKLLMKIRQVDKLIEMCIMFVQSRNGQELFIIFVFRTFLNVRRCFGFLWILRMKYNTFIRLPIYFRGFWSRNHLPFVPFYNTNTSGLSRNAFRRYNYFVVFFVWDDNVLALKPVCTQVLGLLV